MSLGIAILILFLIIASSILGIWLFVKATKIYWKIFKASRGKSILDSVSDDELRQNQNDWYAKSTTWPNPFPRGLSTISTIKTAAYEQLAEATARRLTMASQIVMVLSGAVISLTILSWWRALKKYYTGSIGLNIFSAEYILNALINLTPVLIPVILVVVAIILDRRAILYRDMSKGYGAAVLQDTSNKQLTERTTPVTGLCPHTSTHIHVKYGLVYTKCHSAE